MVQVSAIFLKKMSNFVFLLCLIFSCVVGSYDTSARPSFKVWHIPGLPFVVAAALIVVTIVVLEALHRLESSSEDDDDDEEEDTDNAATRRSESGTVVKIADAASLMAPPVADAAEYRPLPKA